MRLESKESEEICKRSIVRECESFLLLSLLNCCREQKAHECKEAKTEVPEEFIATEDKAKKEELHCLALALEEVKDLVEHNADSLQSVFISVLSLSLISCR